MLERLLEFLDKVSDGPAGTVELGDGEGGLQASDIQLHVRLGRRPSAQAPAQSSLSSDSISVVESMAMIRTWPRVDSFALAVYNYVRCWDV